MKRLQYYFMAICLVLSLFTVEGENISIAQIDTASLLLTQEVNVYVSVTDSKGEPVKNLVPGMFKLSESSNNKDFNDRNLVRFKTGINETAGTHFLLLVDNSGSMYDDLSGRTTDDTDAMRITYAKDAIKKFVESINSETDTVGLAYFNTNYKVLVEQTNSQADISAALDGIQRPEKKDAYTELYSSLYLSTDDISQQPGRKVIIVLSDGENFPIFERLKEPHPVHGEKSYQYSEPVTRCLEEGISCFTINFGYQEGDRNLDDIAFETGGTVFTARDKGELSNVYLNIQNRVKNEYLLTYKADMVPADKKFVKVIFEGADKSATETTRFYFASTIFGIPLENFDPLFLLFILLALLIWFLLTKIKLSRLNKEAGLEVLGTGGGVALTQTIALDPSGQTVIGSGDDANLTISGLPSVKENHATVVFDKKTSAYTLVSDQEVAVNNNYVKKKKLESGDVINIGGATVVFDDEVFNKNK